MAFHYRLESLLRLQRSIEKQQENLLMACAARVNALKNEMADWEEGRRQKKRQATEELMEGSTGAALGLAAEWDFAARRKQKEIGLQLAKAEAARNEQMAKVRAERQKREVLEGLKERLESSFDQEQLRKVQQVMDDMYLTRAFYWKS
jgi:flagellar biosynthesis chaperone FliJ